jgi:hypothetical protein
MRIPSIKRQHQSGKFSGLTVIQIDIPLIIKGHIKIKAVKRIYEPGYRKSFSTNPIN